MKIAVCVRQVPDTETKIKLKPDNSGIDESGIKWIMNPYDEFAVEEALKLKEANAGSLVTVFSLGPKARTPEVIRTALAMGADDGVLIHCEETLDSLATANALAKAIAKKGGFDLILTGKLAIDDNASSVSQMIAGFLNLPHTTVVSKLTISSGVCTVEREVEGGTKEIVQLNGPAVIAANKGLNQPRYASLPGIMKAKKKPIEEIDLASLGIAKAEPKIKTSGYQLPKEKPPVKIIAGDSHGVKVKELTRLLREEAKVI